MEKLEELGRPVEQDPSKAEFLYSALPFYYRNYLQEADGREKWPITPYEEAKRMVIQRWIQFTEEKKKEKEERNG